MLRTQELEGTDIKEADLLEQFLVDADWYTNSNHHTELGSIPAAAIFGRDMLYDIPYIDDWKKIGQHRKH